MHNPLSHQYFPYPIQILCAIISYELFRNERYLIIMNIIIVGCGKVGCTLVEALSIENHNIVVIDSRPEKVSALTDTVDVMGIVGNGVSHTTLKQAGIETADLLIAVTGSDEENLLCCVIAKKSGHCQTIARIRNPIYNEEKDFLQKEFGLSMIINP